ncbi:DUF317 domain-containing protein [Streptomyces anulatus]|uniref:DUF317 domain-containing protein n=1 Tax=Streptomyces anulatus TaxID=1892 RepID=UPI003F49FF7F
MSNQNTTTNDATAPTESGVHEALLDAFLDDHTEWERWRTWSDETTHAVHESLALRAELVHEPAPASARWRFAVYESPVGARLWHATACSSTPTEVIGALLLSLATRAADYPHAAPRRLGLDASSGGPWMGPLALREQRLLPTARHSGRPRHGLPCRMGARRPRPEQLPLGNELLGNDPAPGPDRGNRGARRQ